MTRDSPFLSAIASQSFAQRAFRRREGCSFRLTTTTTTWYFTAFATAGRVCKKWRTSNPSANTKYLESVTSLPVDCSRDIDCQGARSRDRRTLQAGKRIEGLSAILPPRGFSSVSETVLVIRLASRLRHVSQTRCAANFHSPCCSPSSIRSSSQSSVQRNRRKCANLI